MLCAARMQIRALTACAQARELKKHIDSIRADYKQNMKSKDESVVRWKRPAAGLVFIVFSC